MTRYRMETESSWVKEFDTPAELGAALADRPAPGEPVHLVAVEDDGSERPLTEAEQDRFDDGFGERLRARRRS